MPRIALVSDIHGNLPALQAVVRDIVRRGVDAVVNLGDSLSGPLLALETAQFLMAQDTAPDAPLPWLHLAGNHERQLLALPNCPLEKRGESDAYAHAQLGEKELAWLATLPATVQYTSDVLLCHGTPSSDLVYFLETVEPTRVRAATPEEITSRLGAVSASLIACGHTHVPRCVRTAQGQCIVNPGSVGLPAYTDAHPYPHTIANGSPDARYAIVTQVGPDAPGEQGKQGKQEVTDWQVDLISVPYDHQPMAQLARQRGRPDWAQALATGLVG